MEYQCKVCLISPGTDLPGKWALLALGSFPGLLRQTLHLVAEEKADPCQHQHLYRICQQWGGGRELAPVAGVCCIK